MNEVSFCNSAKREKLKKNNDTASTEQRKINKGKTNEESENNGKILTNKDENDRGKHYKEESIDTTQRDTHIKGGKDWKSELPVSVREDFLASMKKQLIASSMEEFLASVKEEFLASMREEARKIVKEEICRAISSTTGEMNVKITGNKQQTNITNADMMCVLSEAGDKVDNEDKCTVQRKRKRDTPTSEVGIPCFTVDLFEPPPHDEKEEFDKWIKIGLTKNRQELEFY